MMVILLEVLERIMSHEKKFSNITPLLWVMLFDHTCLNMTFPILTLLFFDAQSRLFSPDIDSSIRSLWYGLCIAIPHIINILCTPVMSILSDEWGRKKILCFATFGAFLFAITAALGVIFGMLSLLFLGRLIQGAFSRTNPIAQAVVGDLCSREDKLVAMGYLQTAISVGAFIGPIIGGYFANQFFFQKINFSGPFFIAALLGAISFILSLTIFKETLDQRKREISLGDRFNFFRLKQVLLKPNVIKISIILLLLQISWSLYYQFIPPIIKTQLNFDAHALGFFVGLIAFWLAMATLFGIKWLQRLFSQNQILLISIYAVLLGTLLSMIGLSFKEWHALIWLAAIPTSIGDVIAYSCLTALYSDAVSKPEQGKVMAICFTVVAIVWALTAMLGGILMSRLTPLPLMVAPLPILFALFLLQSSFGRSLFIAMPDSNPLLNPVALPPLLKDESNHL